MRVNRFSRFRGLRFEPLESRLALATFYVATGGNDSNDGAVTTPWATLQKAANVVNPGDKVIVRPGNYVGFDLRRDGTAAERIVFQAEAGVNITSRNAITPDGINLEGADYVTIDGFTVNNMPRTGIRTVLNRDVIIRNNRLDNNSRWGILTGFSDDLLIENNIASRSQIEHGIYVSNSGDRPIVRNNILWGNNANGLHMNGDIFSGGDGIITGALVEGNVIYGNGNAGGSGINADGVQNSIFRNNLIYDTHASGISLYRIDGGGGSSNNTVVNNTVIVASNGRWALNIQAGSIGNTIRNNILLNLHSFRGSIDISADSLPGFSSDYNVLMNRMTTDGGNTIQSLIQWRASTGQDQHSVVATPAQVFVNSSAFDFHLLPNGPAVNAGTSAAAPTIDIEGHSRPQGSAWDIGAYEVPVAGSAGNAAIAQATYSSSEVAGSIIIEVARSGGDSGAVSVAYATTNGSAIAGEDYAATSGVLNWADGDMSAQTFSIPLINDSAFESDESFSVALSNPTNGLTLGTNASATVTITSDDPPPLSVVAFGATATGAVIEFNRSVDATELNLYDIQSQLFGPADVVLVGAANGLVRGSLVVDPNLQKVTFIRTGGLLMPDSYTLTLRSASNGFKDAMASLLDGNGDGIPGDDYVRNFAVPESPASAVIVNLPDFARGPQQVVNVPSNVASGIPVSVSNAAGITSATFQINYSPALLSINSASVAPGLPAGAIVNLNTSTPGVATITFSSPTPLAAGAMQLVEFQANVPNAAGYREKQVLDIANISLNGGAIPALDDDAVHVVAYFGDVTANGTYSAQDASQVARLAVGLDGGLASFKMLDPAIMADITGNGSFSATDTSRMLQAAVGILVPEIPTPLPTVSLIQGGPDPKLSIPRNLIATAGQSLSIPVEIDSIVDLTGNGLTSADLVLYYDPRVIDVHRATLGTLLSSLGGWMISSRIDPLAGRIDISIASSSPLEGTFIGELVQLQASVREQAPAGNSAINLAATSRSRSTQLNEGFLTLIPAPTDAANDPTDGLLTILENPQRPSGPQAAIRISDNHLVITGTTAEDRILIGQLHAARVRVRIGQRILGDFPLPAGVEVTGIERGRVVTNVPGLSSVAESERAAAITDVTRTFDKPAVSTLGPATTSPVNERQRVGSIQDFALLQLLEAHADQYESRTGNSFKRFFRPRR